jgi:hypothetical protein
MPAFNVQQFDFALTLGPGERAWKTLFAVRSINRHCPASAIHVFIPEEDEQQVPKEVLEEIRQLAHTQRGSLPMKQYPISAKIKALDEAVNRSDANQVILLDSDVVLVDEPSIGSEAELMAKPVDISTYYTKTKSGPEWQELASITGLSEPARDTHTDVEGKRSRNYYNAGVVATSSEDLPSRWLKLTQKIYDHVSHPFQTDQVALGLLRSNYEFAELERKQNFPVPHFLPTGPDAEILHYHDYNEIPKIRTEELLEELKVTGLLQHYRENRDWQMMLSTLKSHLAVAKRRTETRLGGTIS